MQNSLKNELQDILSGKSKVGYGTIIQSAACYLTNGQAASQKAERTKQVREQEEERLRRFVTERNLWLSNIDFNQYVSEGAEQKVYLKDSTSVIKLNDAIYYESWQDYFYNLLLHNFFFPDTAYNLLGFTTDNTVLFAVVEQAYIATTGTTDLNFVKNFMEQNGFENNRNHDYYNAGLGIILEDLHDENVLMRNEILYFIDTVFYITDNFWEK